MWHDRVVVGIGVFVGFNWFRFEWVLGVLCYVCVFFFVKEVFCNVDLHMGVLDNFRKILF